MVLEVVKAFSLEHIRWLTPLQEYALREVKGASVEGGRVEPDTRRLYDSVTESVRDGNYWILCDCLSDGSERPVTVPSRGRRGIRLGNLPNAQVPHDGDCVFRLREASQGTSGYFFNPLLHERHDAHSTKRDPEQETWRRTGRSVPPVAHVLKCFMREARLHTLAGAERSPSPADWLAELKNTASAFLVAPRVPASEVLFTDPASWRSGEVRKKLDDRAQNWPKGPPPCGYLCWVAHDVEGHDINGRTRGAGHVRVTSPVVSRIIHDKMVEGPYLFLGVVALSTDDDPGWECRMAYAQPIASPQLPIPVDSDYERQAILSLARLVRDLRSDTKLEEALDGIVGFDLQKPLFPTRVHEGHCLPDVLLTVTRPGGSGRRPRDPNADPPEGRFDDGDKARYVLEVMGFDDPEYEKKKEETHRRMERLGRVLRLEAPQFGSAHNGLERQLERIAVRIVKDVIWRWTGSSRGSSSAPPAA